jgi:cyclic beta-1,2-glucan synthetase
MASLEKYLIRHDDALALLFSPPFDKPLHDPGYIKGYPPGLRENGGQYSHAAMWAILAFTQLGHGDKATQLFSLLNPINHARTAEASLTYKVEPYVVAADVYSVSPHIGRGGWTWYTGAAGWMYRAGVEGILGVRREGASLVIRPCIPANWPGFKATISIDSSSYIINVENPSLRNSPISYAILDETRIHITENGARVPLDGNKHTLEIFI